MSSIYSSSSWKPTVFLFEPKIFPSNLLFGQISIANTVFPADPFSCRCFLSYLKQSIINSKAFIPRSIGFYTSTNFHRNAQKWDKNHLEEKIICLSMQCSSLKYVWKQTLVPAFSLESEVMRWMFHFRPESLELRSGLDGISSCSVSNFKKIPPDYTSPDTSTVNQLSK